MAYKTDRNRILRDINRLIIADMNGETWACPDAYFATAYPIYNGYKVKKDQTDWAGKDRPKLHEVLKQFVNYIEPDKVERVTSHGLERVRLAWADTVELEVNAQYYDFLMGLYPGAVAKVCIDGVKYAPVEIHSDGALVGVIMPLNK